MNAPAPTYLIGYSKRDGDLHAWYKPAGGVKRWVDNDQPLDFQILKGNADLVPAEHAYLRVVDADFEARR